MPEAATATAAPPRDATKEIGFGDAVREAIAEEMRRDPTVVLMGEDVAEAGTTFKVLKGLVEEFGHDPHHRHADLGGRFHRPRRRRRDDRHAPDRRHHVRRLPDAGHGPDRQPGGQDPLHVRRQVEGADRHPRDDGRDPAVGGAALAVAARLAEPHSRPEGRRALDPVRREGALQGGRPRRQSGGLLRGQDQLHEGQGPVPTEEYAIPLGVADVKREGSDITLVATSSMVQVALGAAAMLEEVGISAEVVDPRTTWPLDEETLINSVKKTSRCIVMDEGYVPLQRRGRNGANVAGGRVLRPRRPGAPPLRDARADSVLAVARGRYRADGEAGVRSGAADVQSLGG